MRKSLLFLTSVLLCAITFAQSVPQGINYQGVARDANGLELTNESLDIRFSVVSTNTTGTVYIAYQETHAVTTNEFGLFTTIIGGGSPTLSSPNPFNMVAWGAADYSLKVEIDYGNGFADMGTTQLLSVPYALHAGNPGPAGSDGADGVDGAQGSAGADGADGADGATGPQGPAGIDGTNGVDGVDGADGADGVDIVYVDSAIVANALWVDDGYGNIQNVNSSGDVKIQADEFRIQDQYGSDKFRVNQYGDVDIEGYHVDIGDGYSGVSINYGDVDIVGSEFRVRDYSWNEKFKVDYSGDVYMSGNNNYISGGLDVSGNATFSNDVSGSNQPTQNEHLTRKDYVNAGDDSNTAAILAVQADVDQNELDADAAISAVQADVDQNEADIDAHVASVYTTFNLAIGTANTAIAAETNRAIAAETALQADVDQNELDADNAILALQADIDQNEADADAAIGALQADVYQNELDADYAMAALQADVYQNELDADAAIGALQADVDQNELDADYAMVAEASTRQNNDAILDQKIEMNKTWEVDGAGMLTNNTMLGVLEVGIVGDFEVSGNTALIGNVGIGTFNPIRGKLEISGNQLCCGGTNGSFNYFLGGSGNQTWNWYSGTDNFNISVYADGRFMGEGIHIFSDERIKDIVGLSNNKEDLSTLLSIEVTDYKMKDKAKGDRPYKKVIAQQVKQVYPQAISLSTEVVPDIYKVSTIDNGYVSLETDLKAGDKVRLILEDETSLFDVISADKNGFKVATDKSGKVFVYGREVDDFHAVDYESISMLNVSATQELYKLISKQQKIIEDQNTEMAEMQTNFDERLKEIEQILNTTTSNK